MARPTTTTSRPQACGGLGHGADAGDVRGEGRDRDPVRRVGDELASGSAATSALARALAVAHDVGRVADERQHALVAERPEGRLRRRCRRDRASGRSSSRRYGRRGRAACGSRARSTRGSSARPARTRSSNGPSCKRRPGCDLASARSSARRARDSLRVSIRRGREARRVDRRPQPRPHLDERADMVLVRMGDEDAEEVVLALLDEGQVRDTSGRCPACAPRRRSPCRNRPGSTCGASRRARSRRARRSCRSRRGRRAAGRRVRPRRRHACSLRAAPLRPYPKCTSPALITAVATRQRPARRAVRARRSSRRCRARRPRAVRTATAPPSPAARASQRSRMAEKPRPSSQSAQRAITLVGERSEQRLGARSRQPSAAERGRRIGQARGRRATLTPMPTTTARRPPASVSVSSRMPASLAPSGQHVVRPFEREAGPARSEARRAPPSRRRLSASATSPATKPSCGDAARLERRRPAAERGGEIAGRRGPGAAAAPPARRLLARRRPRAGPARRPGPAPRPRRWWSRSRRGRRADSRPPRRGREGERHPLRTASGRRRRPSSTSGAGRSQNSMTTTLQATSTACAPGRQLLEGAPRLVEIHHLDDADVIEGADHARHARR